MMNSVRFWAFALFLGLGTATTANTGIVGGGMGPTGHMAGTYLMTGAGD